VYISVIIPTYNRLPILQQCLRALAQQQPGPYDGYEVVVVDDGSTDGTVEWLQSQLPALPSLKLLCQEHRGPCCSSQPGFSPRPGIHHRLHR
jgi:glycosyltransferase involved in cell wall biosynthesis